MMMKITKEQIQEVVIKQMIMKVQTMIKNMENIIKMIQMQVLVQKQQIVQKKLIIHQKYNQIHTRLINLEIIYQLQVHQ